MWNCINHLLVNLPICSTTYFLNKASTDFVCTHKYTTLPLETISESHHLSDSTVMGFINTTSLWCQYGNDLMHHCTYQWGNAKNRQQPEWSTEYKNHLSGQNTATQTD